ncbi:MAG: tetratricopeptide repeat protein [Nitrospinae bacterium]|nr:tetratricopeptide repeat protein [Nitrospinota bacterium]
MSKVENPKAGMRILVVDDMPGMRKTLRSMLKMLGYDHITEADDGDTALNRLKQGQQDFIIADWNMPRMPGVELLREIRDEPMLRDTPFIMITAEVDDSQIVRAAEEDVDGYIIKPFVAEILERKINSVLDKKANPSQVEIYLKVGYAYMENGMLNEAMREFEHAHALNPKSARIPLAMAQIFEAMGDRRKAEELFTAAVSNNPRFVKGYHTLADFQLRMGNDAAAMKALQSATSLSPNNPSRQVEFGKLLIKAGRVEDADQAFKHALKSAGKSADVHTAIGEAYLAAGHDDKAAEAFRGSLTITEDINVYNRLGIALRRKKRFKEAIQEYRKALAVAPNDEVLYYNIGRALLEDEQREAAIIAFRKALQIDPEFKECGDMLKQLEVWR